MRKAALAVAVVIVAFVAACASISTVGVGTQSRITFNGQALSAGGPYQLRIVENGVVTPIVVAQTLQPSGTQRLNKQEVIDVAVTFDYPPGFDAQRARCMAIVDHLGLPVSIRGRGRGLERFAFANAVWNDRAAYEVRLNAAQSALSEANQTQRREEQNFQNAQSRFANSRANVSGQCVLPAQRPEPARPANAYDPSQRASRVQAHCQAALAQRLGCNSASVMLRNAGIPISPMMCGQDRSVVPSDSLTGLADLFENSFLQSCISGNAAGCLIAGPVVRSRQDHCTSSLTSSYSNSYNSWSSRVREVRNEPEQLRNQCNADVQSIQYGPQRTYEAQERVTSAEESLRAVEASAPDASRTLNLVASSCTG